MTDEMPEIIKLEVETAVQNQELAALKEKQQKQKDKKKKERYVLGIFIIVCLAFLFGYAIGVQSGYESALVDFAIIKGTIFPPL